MGMRGRVGERVGEIGVSSGFSMATSQIKINRVTDTIKIKAQIRSSFVGAWVRVWGFRATSRAMAAVMSSFIWLNR